MDVATHVLLEAAAVQARNEASSTAPATGPASRPPVFRVVGVVLAICSGIFIGVSFVVKKKGLLQAAAKYNEEPGQGYGFLRNWLWILGLALMIIGEIANLVAYAFLDAAIVATMGSISVVVTAILSAIFLKERLSFVGKVSCFLCIIGSVIIVLNSPEQSAVADIQQMQSYVITPSFLSFAGVIILICLFVAFWAGPRYGKKSMLVYLTVCSLIGGLSVVGLQGLGAAVLAQAGGKAQFTNWFVYVLLFFVIGTLVTEIIFLNRCLGIYQTGMVSPAYYVYFSAATIVSSAVLFKGFKGTAMSIATVVMGFLVTCSGVVLLQLAKSSKDVPDAAIFKGDLDQVKEIAAQEESEMEPRADTIRGGASIARALSRARTMRQAEEARRIHDDMMEPIHEGETVEWDGLRRRRTMSDTSGSVIRRKPQPSFGLRHLEEGSEADSEMHPGFFGRFGRKSTAGGSQKRSDVSPVPMSSIRSVPLEQRDLSTAGSQMYSQGAPTDGALDVDTSYKSPTTKHLHWAGDVVEHERDRPSSKASSLAPPPPPHGGAKRTFSFQNVFNRNRADSADRPTSRGGLSFRSRHSDQHAETEEERLGLVQGDTSKRLPKYDEVPDEDSDEWQVTSGTGDDIGRQRPRDDTYDYSSDSDEDLGKQRLS